MNGFTESMIEEAALGWFQELGSAALFGHDLDGGGDGHLALTPEKVTGDPSAHAAPSASVPASG
ncbi:hypothetical protein NZK32_09180 [Cyanobium sp. FGCU-52]|nr:hypothetical protein [Cyanobium sp. FGCU52]